MNTAIAGTSVEPRRPVASRARAARARRRIRPRRRRWRRCRTPRCRRRRRHLGLRPPARPVGAAAAAPAARAAAQHRPTAAATRRISAPPDAGPGRLQRVRAGDADHRGAGADREHLEDHRGSGRRPRSDAGLSRHHRHAGDRPHLPRDVLAQTRHRPDPRGRPSIEALSPARQHPSPSLRSAARTSPRRRARARRSHAGSIRHSNGCGRSCSQFRSSERPASQMMAAPTIHCRCSKPPATHPVPRDTSLRRRPATWSGSRRARQDSPTRRARARRWSGSPQEIEGGIRSSTSGDGRVSRPAPASGTTSRTPPPSQHATTGTPAHQRLRSEPGRSLPLGRERS